MRATKTFCKGYGSPSVLNKAAGRIELKPPARALSNFYVEPNRDGKSCDKATTDKYVANGTGVKVVEVGPGSKEEILKIVSVTSGKDLLPAATASLPDLPLIVLEPKKIESDYFVIFLSGDGGWAGFDKELSAQFVAAGTPVVGWNSLDYFWDKKSAETGAADLERIISTFKRKWSKDKVLVVGYSFGADVAPFFVAGLNSGVQKNIKAVALLGPAKTAEFEFHFTDWITDSDEGHLIEPELKKLRGKVPVKCLYGEEEDTSLCASVEKGSVEVFKLPGGHHFDGDAKNLFKIISGG